MLLIYPPVARSTEAPLGIARLAGFLGARGIRTRLLDLNHEGMEFLLAAEIGGSDTWTKGALKRRSSNLDLLRKSETYRSPDRYARAVLDLNRALKAASASSGAEAGLANYVEFARTPLSRSDLQAAAKDFGLSPYFPLFSRRIEEELAVFPATRVGLSLDYLSQALPAFAVLGYLAEAHPEIERILGGGLVSSWIYQGALRTDDDFCGLVDAVLPGRGEEALAWHLRLSGEKSHEYSRGGDEERFSGPESAPPEPSASFAHTPPEFELPDFSDFEKLKYLSPVRVLPYNFTSGCPWKRCSFCPEKAEDARYAGIRIESASAEIASLVRAYKPGFFHFTDNEIAPLYLRSLVNRPPGRPWYGFARFSAILEDREFCFCLADSGCRMLQLGLESGDQAVLDALGKGTRLEAIDAILENLARAGIATFVYVLFGTPAEDRIAAARTRDYLESRADMIGFLNIAIFNMPASSHEAKALDTRSFYDGELSLYREFVHPRGWDRDEVRAFVGRELESCEPIRRIIRRCPPIFTSNHAPFFADLQPYKTSE